MDDEATQALLELDETIAEFKKRIERCGQLVNEGKLDGNVILLKFMELQQEMMTGGAPA